jgi:GAF domain-containing protein
MDHADPFTELNARWHAGTLLPQAFAQEVAMALAGVMRCPRAGIWVFVEAEDEAVLRCLAMVDVPQGRFDSPTDMTSTEAAIYFRQLMREGHVIADDAMHHPATAPFYEDYLRPNDVQSILDVAIGVNDELLGVLTCEHVGSRYAWTRRHLQKLRIIGSRLALTLREVSVAAGIPYAPPTRPGEL